MTKHTVKKFACVLTAATVTISSFTALAAASEKTTYTFTALKTATKGNTEDVENAALTSDISVTTSGPANYKIAAVTDTEHNSELGTRPIGGGFTADTPYLYLSTASTNNGTVITLTVPKIEKGSCVELTYAKPIITNNGSTVRNQNDPYAYFEIGGRYISINGGDFDTWRTDYVVTAEDTDKIVFHADKWGTAAVSKIEISDGASSPLQTLTVATERFANVTVNGIKRYADISGTLTDYIENGKTAEITAEKTGYESSSQTVVMTADQAVELPLTCTENAVYYESDFGTDTGTVSLDGEFSLGDTIETKAITDFFGNITFTDAGKFMPVFSGGTSPFVIEYKDGGIYINDTFVTSKDNMEFHAVIDGELNEVVLTQNGEQTAVPLREGYTGGAIAGITGNNVTVDTVGADYPAFSDIAIVGAEKLSPGADAKYTAQLDYMRPNTSVTYSVLKGDADISEDGTLRIAESASGEVVIRAEYEGAAAEKTIEIVVSPKITAANFTKKTMSLHETAKFCADEYIGEYENEVYPTLKDFTSSDPSVVTIDTDGTMHAVGIGTATVGANAFTGTDNPISAEITVDSYYIDGYTENSVTYIENTFGENENVIGYTLNLSDGTSAAAEPTSVPAATIPKDGTVVTAVYDGTGKLVSARQKAVKAGDKTTVSNGTKTVYFSDGGSMTRLTDADTVTDGFAVTADAGERYEIDPVYRYDNIGDVAEGKTLGGTFADGYYDITFKKGETFRADIYVNGYMAGNNVDQADADRKVTDGALYTAEDLKIAGGTINVSMTDGSTVLDYVTLQKKPNFYDRPQRVYIIGDSLACAYYGDFEQEVGGGRSGWGQQLPDFLTVPVTNLANSGQFAAGLYRTAFPSVIANGVEGDILLIECAYNDRNYSNRAEMTACVKDMISQCRDAGITPILVTPNASRHDYKPSVAWSGYLRDIAVDCGCALIDLSKESYDFLYSLYGDDADNVVTMNYNLTAVGGDTLHSSYAGAYKWAAIVAHDMKDLGFADIVNTEFKYEFTDTLGNKITASAE